MFVNLFNDVVRLFITNKLIKINDSNEMRPKIFIPLKRIGVLSDFDISFINFLADNLGYDNLELDILPPYLLFSSLITFAFFWC